MPTVSFILPAYKRQFLREAIDSILSQSYRDYELVIVDDASPERLADELKNYSWFVNASDLADGGREAILDGIRVRYYCNSHNIGKNDLVESWNHAMKYATSEWCVLASDDDKYAPDYLETMISLKEKYPSVDIFHCKIACIDQNGIITSVGESRSEWESCWEMLYNRGIRGALQSAPEFMFSRRLFESIGGFVNFPTAISSDSATWYSLARENGVVCSNKCLFFWRLSGINISTRMDNIIVKAQAILQCNAWFEKFFTTVPISTPEDHIFKRLVLAEITSVRLKILDDFLKKLNLFKWLKAMHNLSIPDQRIRNFLWKSRLKRLWMLHL